ncbi:uncharacterized protein LOC111602668 isoform X2 [Drosophila hydei]|uniref:Uncharacterized protein LOC111602668 isoform X2 n=1 Tax=Drosophila hydei TaxID=7224 RepID=A0A6J1M6B6_DROHY|nr:uncharacterized protein LOC111602668 isoform X2 [Drosophila hydei]
MEGVGGTTSATKKSTLSVDRAAFLLLRVKKAFKKKRQQRKDRQAQHSASGCMSGNGQQSLSSSRKFPPLLRSRTLPAIIVPGLPVVSLRTHTQPFHLDCKSRSGSAIGHRWSVLSAGSGTGGGATSGSGTHNNNNTNLSNNNNNTLMVKSLNLPKDDCTLIYRRKSSGSSPHAHAAHAAIQQQVAQQNLYLHQQHVADSSTYQLSDDFECHADGSLLLRIPSPQAAAPLRGYPNRLGGKKHVTTGSEATTPMVRESHHLHDFATTDSSGSGAHTTFTRLAKLLHQSRSTLLPQPPMLFGENFVIEARSRAHQTNSQSILGLGEDAPRRLSWERRKDSSALQRSASIDSFAEIVFSDLPRPSLDVPRSVVATPTPFSKRPSASSLYSTCSSIAAATAASAQVHAQLNVNYGDLTTHPHQHQLPQHLGNCSSIAANSRRESMLSPSSTRRNKLTRIINALFSAVENGHLEKARTILESTDVDINSINIDGLSALDVAVLSNNRSMTKMLLQHGALQGSQYSIGTKLNGLLKDAETRIHDLSGPEGLCTPIFTSRPSISSIIIGNAGSSVTGCTGNEVDKQIGISERRVKGLRRMLLGWDQTRLPDAPASVVVDVTGDTSISLQILEPFEGAIATKFKIQWSTRADFSNVVGERELFEWISFHGNMGAHCHIAGLTQGRRYFLRGACGNVKGWGRYRNSVPASVVPSTWRDLENREDRSYGCQCILDNLFAAVRLARPADVSELTLDPCNVQRRNPKKKTTIKQLFSVTSKFQKTLRRGIYFSCIVHCDEKILVTSEDFPPVIEIDESYPSALHMDYYWLMKVACTWEDVKSLRADMERNLSSPVHFRTKLLSAVCQMQSALGIMDLGQLYYKPLRDAQGTVVLTCIQSVKSQKAVSIINSRWLPVNKLKKKLGALHEDYTINELLISSIGEQLHYQQAALQRLDPGLYLGYLKMQCSMDQIQVVVPVKTPNVLPHCKVRENSHITAEEWQVLHRIKDSKSIRLPLDFSVPSDNNGNDNGQANEVQCLFLHDLSTAMHKLFDGMSIKPTEAATHRLYDVEVIEHSRDISFLIVCPSVEASCAVPGQSELLLQRNDFVSLSIQAFEMIHLRTYQPAIVQKYARLSCILELDTALATHSHRQAFSNSELQAAKERLATLQDLSSNLTIVWKSVRWLMDVVAYARNKHAHPVLAIRELLKFVEDQEKQLLHLPHRESRFSKTGRGSWPGPGVNEDGDKSSNIPEHSKSETNLGQRELTPSTAQATPSEAGNKQPLKEQHQEQKSQLLQVGVSEYTASTCSDVSLRKNSGDSVSSAYTARSFASDGSNCVFALPPSYSDDTLADALRHSQATTAAQRKRTSSHTGSIPTPLITVHCSSSVPYLAGSISAFAGDLEQKTLKPSAAEYRLKAASSVNLREGGLYLKSSPAELKPPSSDELTSMAPSTSKTSSTKSLTHQSSEEDSASYSSLNAEQAISSTGAGIIQVYTAYNTGLASGTSLKLHVTPKTTAREVINLVVKQLNMAAVLKGSKGPIYNADMLDNFCLVAVIGARERCLRDDFKPLQLQSPWKKGRLYVRQKHELLAAIEHSNRKSHLI